MSLVALSFDAKTPLVVALLFDAKTPHVVALLLDHLDFLVAALLDVPCRYPLLVLVAKNENGVVMTLPASGRAVSASLASAPRQRRDLLFEPLRNLLVRFE